MIESRLGAVRDPEAPFPPDRIVATVLRVAFLVGVALTVRNTLDWWHHDARYDSALTYPGYLSRAWWVHARYVTSTALAFWLTFGVAQGRRWAFVSLALLAIDSLASAIANASPFNIGLFSSELVYATMRLTGSLGAKPLRKADGRDVPFRLDRYAASLNMLLSVVADVLYVSSTLRGWHRAQDLGSIAYLSYLAQTWWSRIHYVCEEVLVWWTTFALLRSQRWTFVILGILSLGWLFRPIHSGDAFYIWSNAYVLAYCVGRLVWERLRSAGSREA